MARTLELQNGDYDAPLIENIKERRQAGTYIPAGEPADALRVDINGSGTLGNGGEALVVQPGTGHVAGTEHTVASGDTRTLDVSLPGDNDRRDVVFLSDAGSPEVREGRGGSFAWGDGVASGARTYSNAFRPPPPGLQGVPGVVLAIITVRSGQTDIGTDALRDVRVGPPTVSGGHIGGQAIQTSLNGRVVAVAPGIGTVDAIDPSATSIPVQDAIDAVAANSSALYGGSGMGAVLLPPGLVEEAGPLSGYGGMSILGHGPAASKIGFTDTTRPGFDVTAAADAAYSYLDGFVIDGWNYSERAASGGSPRAMHYTNGASPISANIGRVVLDKWPGPVIHADGGAPYGSTWEVVSLRSNGHENAALRCEGHYMPGMEIGRLDVGSRDPSSYAVYIDDMNFGGRIGAINGGGESGRLLYHRDSDRAANLAIGHMNSEPNNAQTATEAVRLEGDGAAHIRHLKLQERLTVDNAVVLGADTTTSTGPADNIIEGIEGGTINNARILVEEAASAPSWYFGPAGHIDYGGHPQSAVIPLADVSLGEHTGGTYDGPEVSATIAQTSIADEQTTFWNTVDISGVEWGDGSMVDAPNDQLVAPSAGQYEIGFVPEFATAGTATTVRARIYINATRAAGPVNRSAATTGMDHATAETVRTASVAAGDTIEVQASQDSGGAINVTSRSSLVFRRVG